MVRIRLRPYHPTYVVAHYGGSVPEGSRARAAFEAIQRKLRENPVDQIEIEIVEEHDDACAGCKFRREAEGGSVWGERHTCTSADDPEMVAAVNRTNEKAFELLGVRYGSVIKLPKLVCLLAENIPVLDDGMLGGMKFQEAYAKGLRELSARAHGCAEGQSAKEHALGLQRGKVKLVAYQEQWAELFRQEEKRLSSALGGLALDIQHVGSTAIPGMSGKPILDVAIAVADLRDVPECVRRLEEIGCTYRGDRDGFGNHLFVKGDETSRTHHLHLVAVGDRQWTDLLRFRDHLIASQQTRSEYLQLKRGLANRYAEDRGAYTDGKAEFIERVLRLPGPRGEEREGDS